jgi:hypothetical protein
MKINNGCLVVLASLFFICGCQKKVVHSEPVVTPTPTPTPIPVVVVPTPTPTPTPIPSPTPTPSPVNNHPFAGDQFFKPYVASFYDESVRQGRTLVWPLLKITLSDVSKYGSNVLGVCVYDGIANHVQDIRISSKYWPLKSEITRQNLINHELGHCVLARDHSYKYMTVQGHQYPSSIMAPSIFSDTLFKNFEGHYLFELFQLPANSLVFKSTFID